MNILLPILFVTALTACVTPMIKERVVLDDHTGQEIIVLGKPTTGRIPIPTPRPY